MQLSRAHHKVMLFCARLMELAKTGEKVANGKRIWLTGKKDPVTDEDIGRFFELSTEDPSNDTSVKKRGEESPFPLAVDALLEYCNGKRPQVNTTLSVLDKAVHKIYPIGPVVDASASANGMTVPDFANRIRLDPEKARYIIDYLHASRFPTYSAVAQPNTTAKDFIRDYGGLYYIYRHDVNSITSTKEFPLGKIARATLSIRYPLPFKPHAAERMGESRIRCKLAIPSYSTLQEPTPKSPPLAYDGYVGTKGDWHQFLLQARLTKKDDATARRHEDLILMYTDELPDAGGQKRFASGVMLTQSQEKAVKPMIASIVIERCLGYRVENTPIAALASVPKDFEFLKANYQLKNGNKAPDPLFERTFMKNEPRLLDSNHKDACEAAFELLKGWEGLNTKGLHGAWKTRP